jgi:GTP-binding protein Era
MYRTAVNTIYLAPMENQHKSGFVNIIGRPNVGKSTLMNALVGEQMSIVTHKPQTTRHRIFGILSGEHFQIVFSDTPGMIKQPRYRMQEQMNSFVEGTFEDADLFLLVVYPGEVYEAEDPIFKKLESTKAPVILVINKADISDQKSLQEYERSWASRFQFNTIFILSALHQFNTQGLLQYILEQLPEGPAYYPKDEISDRSERFFASEIIREKIFLQYQKEIPYSCEVVIDEFKEDPESKGLIRIYSTIYVARKTQKSILIGKNGMKIKELGTEARKHLERFFEQRVYLELFVKVKENWRDDDRSLKYFGY